MPTFSRRSFVAGSAALIAAPAIRARAQNVDVQVAIVGAGAAGIAAARRLTSANVRFAMIEAADRIGGRCITDTGFSAPFDRGAHWIHRPADNPILKTAPTGLDIYPAPRGQKLRVPPRRAREAELEEFLAALVRANRAIADAGRARSDTNAAAALPADLGGWRDSVEFVLGPYSVGKQLSDISAIDFARAPERVADAFCREGYGALLARHATGLAVQLSTPARRIDWGGVITIETPNGTIRAGAAIITASTAALRAIDFTPELPKSHADAIAALALGQQEQIALDLSGNVLDLDPDDLVFEKANGKRTAALLANISGSNLSVVSVGGAFARELARAGEDAMRDFAIEWIAASFGSSIKARIAGAAASRWSENPLIGGAFSAAAPGRADAHRVLMSPLRDRVWFAGEAAHETLWGTVNGAWDSGTRAAEGALRLIGALQTDAKQKPNREEKPRRKRRHRE